MLTFHKFFGGLWRSSSFAFLPHSSRLLSVYCLDCASVCRPPCALHCRSAMSEQAPCPDKILDDCGSAFCMGAVGGAVWHGVKGAVNSPRGERIRGGFQVVICAASCSTLLPRHFPRGALFFLLLFVHLRANQPSFPPPQSLTLRAPSLSVGFGMWGGLFSVFDCSLQHIRGQDDFINAIGAGACTSGLLAARGTSQSEKKKKRLRCWSGMPGCNPSSIYSCTYNRASFLPRALGLACPASFRLSQRV